MYYVCLDCGVLFSEPIRWVERHGLKDGPYEEWYGCPFCGGAYTEAFECDGCGNYITDSYIKLEDGSRYCKECYCEFELGDE